MDMEQLYSYVPRELVTFVLVTLFSLLIGLSQRRISLKREGETTLFGTDRTFTFIGILGYLLYILDPTDMRLFMGGGAVLGLLLGLNYYVKQSQFHVFGVTTIIIALITYCMAPIVATQPSWFYVMVVVTVLLLTELKHTFTEFAQRMKNDEMITLAKFLAISGIILPMLPHKNLIPDINLTPYSIWLATVVVSGCCKHFSAANMDSFQPFLVLPERSGVVSFGTGFSVCHLSPASRRTEKGGCPQAALHCRRDLLRTVPCVLCFLESRAQRKGGLLPDLSVPCVPGGRFYHQLLHGLPLPQPQTGERPAGRCFLPAGACCCATCERLPFYRRQAGGGSGRGGLPVQCAVHSLCGAAGLAACRGQGNHFPAAFRKAVFVAGRAVPLRFSDSSGADPVYGVDCGQVQLYGTSCGLDPDRISAHALPEQLLQGAGTPGAAAPYPNRRITVKHKAAARNNVQRPCLGLMVYFFTSQPLFWR